MPLSEFELITEYFQNMATWRNDVALGIGDDGAVLDMPVGQQLVVTTDTLISGVHFPGNTKPQDVAYKSIAVNLSDLAAMAAVPSWLTLSLTLPEANPEWLDPFCSAMQDISRHFGVQLVGGDVTRGTLSLTITAFGHVSIGQALTRSGAYAGDLVYVTGFIGDAAGGLALHQRDIESPNGDEKYLFTRLNRPSPRVATGLSLRGLSNACIDISDGFVADLSHLLNCSDKGAHIRSDQLPLSEALVHTFGYDKALEMALYGGDDYELCFTIPEFNQGRLETELANAGCHYQCVGRIVGKKGLYIDGSPVDSKRPKGYRHF